MKRERHPSLSGPLRPEDRPALIWTIVVFVSVTVVSFVISNPHSFVNLLKALTLGLFLGFFIGLMFVFRDRYFRS